MSALLKTDYLPHYTYDEYAQWEGDWELIEGVPYAMSPAPNIRHQSLSVLITWKLAQQLRNCPNCQVLHDVDWKISEDTVVQPDNLIICPKASGQYLTRAPQLIVEILSPSTAHKDRTLKFDLYEREGVRWYLIVNPTDNVAHIFERIEGKYRKITDATQEVFSFNITDNCSVELDFNELWAE
jgi:Uma2 family endonuclease